MEDSIFYQNIILHLLVSSQTHNQNNYYAYNIINDSNFNTILETKPYNIKEFVNYFKSYYSQVASKQLFSQIHSLLKHKITDKFLMYYDSILNQTLTDHQKNIYDNIFNNFLMLKKESQIKRIIRLINS